MIWGVCGWLTGWGGSTEITGFAAKVGAALSCIGKVGAEIEGLSFLSRASASPWTTIWDGTWPDGAWGPCRLVAGAEAAFIRGAAPFKVPPLAMFKLRGTSQGEDGSFACRISLRSIIIAHHSSGCQAVLLVRGRARSPWRRKDKLLSPTKDKA